MRNIPGWDQYYLQICQVVAGRSKDPNRVRLFWIFRFTGYDGGFASEKAAYASSFLLTSVSEPRRLRWDEGGVNGTVSGTR